MQAQNSLSEKRTMSSKQWRDGAEREENLPDMLTIRKSSVPQTRGVAGNQLKTESQTRVRDAVASLFFLCATLGVAHFAKEGTSALY
jgi:hypothetical protein